MPKTLRIRERERESHNFVAIEMLFALFFFLVWTLCNTTIETMQIGPPTIYYRLQ